MKTRYHTGRALAIAAGIASTVGALGMLLADPITTGAWRLDHALLPIVVFITIASGHLAGSALRSLKPLSAVGFAALFLLGSVLTVYQSVGSQKQQTGDKAASIEEANRRIADLKAEIARSIERRTMAQTMADREMTGQRCGNRCEDWKRRAAEVASHIKTLEGELAGLGAPRSARPRADALAEVMAVAGYDRTRVAALASTLEPFAFSLLLELTAIVAFGYGFAGSRRHAFREPAAAHGAPASIAAMMTEPPVPPKPKKRQLPANVVSFQAAAQRHPVIAAIEKAGGSVASNRDLARLMAVTEGEASKRVAEVAQLLEIERDGKWRRIRMRA